MSHSGLSLLPAEAVLAYLSRYTHRVAISNSRLIANDKRGVTFRWKDYRAKGRTRYKTMSLQHEEFMRRFLLHVLPSGFHRIRHYGFLANARRKHDIPTVREFLHQPRPTPSADEGAGGADHGRHRPTFVCRHCGAPMLVIGTFRAGSAHPRTSDPFEVAMSTLCSTPQSSSSAHHRAWLARAPMVIAPDIHRSCTRASPIHGSDRIAFAPRSAVAPTSVPLSSSSGPASSSKSP